MYSTFQWAEVHWSFLKSKTLINQERQSVMSAHAKNGEVVPANNSRKLTATQRILGSFWMHKDPVAVPKTKRPSKIVRGTPDWEKYEEEARMERRQVFSKAHTRGALAVDSVVSM